MKRILPRFLLVLAVFVVLSAMTMAAEPTACEHGDWIGTSSLPTEAGQYYLTGSVNLTETWAAPEGNVVLCLNGCSITFSGESGSVIRVPSGGSLTITDCARTPGVISGGKAEQGGGIYSRGSLVLAGGVISGNTAKYGGGIYVESDSLTMAGGTVTDNFASLYGGGIYLSRGSSMTLSGGTISCNIARDQGDAFGYTKAEGGGVYLDGTTMTMTGGLVFDNEAANHGGGICADRGTLLISGGTIEKNSAGSMGGGVYGNTIMRDGLITGNSSDSGGGIATHCNEAEILGGTISSNRARLDGGGIYSSSSRLTISGGAISGNSGSDGGGICAVSVSSGTYLNFTGGSVTENTASRGGGVYLTNQLPVSISGSTVLYGNKLKTGDVSNLQLRSGQTITIAAPLTTGAKIGISRSGSGVLTSGWSEQMPGDNGRSWLFPDNGSTVYQDHDRELTTEAHIYAEPVWTWTDFTAQAAFACSCGRVDPVDGTVTAETITPPTCTVDGLRRHTAAVSFEGTTYTDTKDEPLTSSGHCYNLRLPSDTVVSAATCTEAALYRVKCDNCPQLHESETVTVGAALEHDWSSWTVTVVPTETSVGQIQRSCSRNTEHRETKELPVLSETDYTYEVTTEPTYEAAGEAVWTCNQTMDGQTITITVALDKIPRPLQPGNPPVSQQPAAELPFGDLRQTDWFYDAVAFVWKQGMMNGVGDGVFDPNGTTTRAMIVTILWRLEGAPEAAAAEGFADVAADQWYTEAISWAADSGIVTGYSSTAFGPDDPITREQLAAILWRYAKCKGYDVSVGEETNILSYEDAFSIREYAIPAIQWACGAGLMQGDEGRLDPTGYATRAQAAMMLMRFCSTQ